MGRILRYAGVVGAIAVVVVLAFTCSTSEVGSDCGLPAEGSRAAGLLAEGRSQSAFPVLYPCYLPNSQQLENVAVLGDRGRQSVALTFGGPFDITLHQSQIQPLVNADPSGASHSVVSNLFPGVRAELIEIYDGSSRIIYRLLWTRSGMYYELLAAGPPQQRRTILQIARSLE